jgi:hypothetical protein
MISFDNELASFTQWNKDGDVPAVQQDDGSTPSFVKQQHDALANFMVEGKEVKSLHAQEKEEILLQFGGKKRSDHRDAPASGKEAATEAPPCSEDDTRKWKCRTCTYLNNACLSNSALAVVCEMCGCVDSARKTRRERMEASQEELQRKEKMKLDSLNDLLADMESSDDEDDTVGKKDAVGADEDRCHQAQNAVQPAKTQTRSPECHTFRGSFFLPTDLLSIVLLMLGEPKDCISVMNSCRLWSFIVIMDSKLWKVLANRVEDKCVAQSQGLRKKNGGWLSYGGGRGPRGVEKSSGASSMRRAAENGSLHQGSSTVPHYTEGAFVCTVCALQQATATERDTCEMCAGDVIFAPVELDGEPIELSLLNDPNAVAAAGNATNHAAGINAAFTRVDSLDHFKRLYRDGEGNRRRNELNIQRRAVVASDNELRGNEVADQQPDLGGSIREMSSSSSSSAIQRSPGFGLFGAGRADGSGAGGTPRTHRLAFGLSRTMSEKTHEEMTAHHKFKERCLAITTEMDVLSKDPRALAAAASAAATLPDDFNSPRKRPKLDIQQRSRDDRCATNHQAAVPPSESASALNMCGTPHDQLFLAAEMTGDYYFATKCFLCDRKQLKDWQDYRSGWSWLQKTLRCTLRDICQAVASSSFELGNPTTATPSPESDFECGAVVFKEMDEGTKRQMQKVMWKLTQRNWVMLYECLGAELHLQAEGLVRDAVRANIRDRGDTPEMIIAECIDFNVSSSETILDTSTFEKSLAFNGKHPRARPRPMQKKGGQDGGAVKADPKVEMVMESAEAVQSILSLWRAFSAWVNELEKHCDFINEKIQIERERSWRSGSTPSIVEIAMAAFRSQAFVPCWMRARLGKAISCHYHLGPLRHECDLRRAKLQAQLNRGHNEQQHQRHHYTAQSVGGQHGQVEVDNANHEEILECLMKAGLDVDVETDGCFSMIGTLLGTLQNVADNGDGMSVHDDPTGRREGHQSSLDRLNSDHRHTRGSLIANETWRGSGGSSTKKRKRKKRGQSRFSWEVETGFLDSGDGAGDGGGSFDGGAESMLDEPISHSSSGSWRLSPHQLRQVWKLLPASLSSPVSPLALSQTNINPVSNAPGCQGEQTHIEADVMHVLLERLCKLYYVLCAVDVADDRLCCYKTQAVVRSNLLLPLHNVFVFSLSSLSSKKTSLGRDGTSSKPVTGKGRNV